MTLSASPSGAIFAAESRSHKKVLNSEPFAQKIVIPECLHRGFRIFSHLDNWIPD